MTTVTQAVTDLTTWLPHAQALTHQPDTVATSIRGKPGSRPPWNPAVANALLDALEGIRRLEQAMRSQVANRHVTIRSIHVTGGTLESITRLSAASSTDEQHQVVVQLTRYTTTILQLPAIGREERWRKITGAACPYCGLNMLLAAPQSGRVTCLRFGACFDSRDCHPVGVMDIGPVSGEPMIAWADGRIQLPPQEVTT